MINLNEIITGVPINAYIVVACCIVGFVMKKWLPTDNKIIPTVLPIVGAVLAIPVMGLSVEFIIGGAFSGVSAVGCHQLLAQRIENTKDRNEILSDEEVE